MRPIFVLLGFLILLPVQAGSFSLTDHADNQLQVEVMPAEGDLLVIWLVDHDELRPQFEQMLSGINQQGIELWRVDILADYFQPRNSDSIIKLPGDPVASLIERATQQTEKRIILAAYDRMPLPLLKGLLQWQRAGNVSDRLLGAILFYPNLYGEAPIAGKQPDLLPIVSETNYPLIIYQPELGAHALRLKELLQSLWSAGSPATAYLARGVRDWFFMHQPGENRIEDLASGRVVEQINAFAYLLEQQPRPSAAPPPASRQTLSGVGPQLVEFPSPPEAPALKLRDYRGIAQDLKELAGRVVLVNFWATWCPPCVEEIPSLNQLLKHYPDDKFQIISVDFRESSMTLAQFVQRQSVDFPILMDTAGEVALAWRVFSFPSSFLVDKKGRIRYSVNQAIDWTEPEARLAVEKLIAEVD